MYKFRLRAPSINTLKKLKYRKCFQAIQRNISALFVTDDQATENNNTISPYMDFNDIFKKRAQYDASLAGRKLSNNLNEMGENFELYKKYIDEIEALEKERQDISQTLKDMAKSGVLTEAEENILKEKGRAKRSRVKTLKEEFYPLEDQFVHSFLDLPNELHPKCPIDNKEIIVYQSPAPRVEKGESHLKRTDLIKYIEKCRYFLMEQAAEFDVFGTQAMANHIIQKCDFLLTSNPDFARSVLLEAIGTPIETYHRVIDKYSTDSLNQTYLVGGGAFESYLAAIVRICINPKSLPMRLVSIGRSYKKIDEPCSNPDGNLYIATQTNSIQTLAVTETASEADKQMEEILSIASEFYRAIGIHFRIVYVDASKLTISESLRAEIQVYSPVEKRYICSGSISNYSDFLSKRILFTTQKNKDYHFLHMVGGSVMYSTRVIASMIETGVSLDYTKLPGYVDATEAVNSLMDFKCNFRD